MTLAQATASKRLHQHFSVNVLLESQHIQVCKDAQPASVLQKDTAGVM